MNRRTRFNTAISAVALAAVLAGCAAGQQSRESIFGSKMDRSNIGLATRAQAALEANQLELAVEFAERAVANTPNDAGFRALLGNCYFAAGRFGSAAMAYRDSLSLIPNQPKVVLKLALVQIGQGRGAEALAVLDAARDSLDPADYGLAVALAGRPADAVTVLNDAARFGVSDARTRQNHALEYGLAGDWAMARTVAAQDLPPEQVDGRIQQWMTMAKPGNASEQVAALTGIRPIAGDPGQPKRLALQSSPQRNEAYAYATVPPQPQPQPQPAQVAPQEFAALPDLPPPALPEPAPQMAEVAPAAVADAARELLQPQQPAQPVVAAVEKPVEDLPTRFDAPVTKASFVSVSKKVRRAAENLRRGNGKSSAVVQLGAYGSPERVSVAWDQLTKRYPGLRDYTPMRARFDGPQGTVWRLSIKGFASRNEAVDRCELLQSRGGKCFVRTLAGDAPVQLASR